MAGRTDIVVATVFGGVPPAKSVVTAYDQLCGFTNAEEAVTARRSEDREAMAYLQADIRHLEFLDSQYGIPADQSEISNTINDLLNEIDPEYVTAPLGLFHRDHVAVREAALEAMNSRDTPLWLWEDLPARVQHPESVVEALDELRGRGYELDLGFIGTGPIATKMDALFCYRSQLQLPEFANRHEFLVTERFWQISKAVTPEESE
jgi:LmbE family N-acetylglucosaminyl deacetylase